MENEDFRKHKQMTTSLLGGPHSPSFKLKDRGDRQCKWAAVCLLAVVVTLLCSALQLYGGLHLNVLSTAPEELGSQASTAAIPISDWPSFAVNPIDGADPGVKHQMRRLATYPVQQLRPMSPRVRRSAGEQGGPAISPRVRTAGFQQQGGERFHIRGTIRARSIASGVSQAAAGVNFGGNAKGNAPPGSPWLRQKPGTMMGAGPRSDACSSRHLRRLVDLFRTRMGNRTFTSQAEALKYTNKKERFDPSHLHVLPLDNKDALHPYKFDRCAVVGNSGHLRLTNYGTAINLFDVVMRTNQAPIKDYAKYIGSKTTFRLINRSISKMYMRSMGHGRMRGPKSQPKPEPPAQRRLLQKEGENEGETIITIGGSKLPLEHNVTMALITETRSRPADVKKFYNVIHPMRPDVRILALSGQARRAAEALLVSWNKQQKACTGRNTGKNNLNRGTTGLLAVTSMMYLCKKTVLFGFGQPRGGTQAAPYHYYTGLRNRSWRSKSSDVHNFAGEASLIRHLSFEGYIQMCNEVSPPTCGLPHWKIHELAKKTGKQPIVVDGAPSLNISFDDIGDAPEDDEYESLEITNAELAEQLLQEAAENAQDAAAGADPNVDAELGEVTDDAQEEA